MADKKNITIIDIAKLTGLSKATVGRVIGNYGNVSPESKEKVEKAIKELNYIPNAVAQGLRSNGTKIIGVIVGSIKNNFCNRFLYAVEKAAIEKGYDVLFCNTGEQIEREFQCIKNLKARRVDGIILISSVLKAQDIPKENMDLYKDIPIVLADRNIEDMDLDLITSSNCQGAYNIIKSFIQNGHQHIGIISYGEVSTLKERLRGYRQACDNYKIQTKDSYILTGKTIDDISTERIKEFLKQNPQLTAIMVLNNSLLAKLLVALKDIGCIDNDRYSIVSWDDDELNELYAISTVEQQVEEIGLLSTKRLIEIINRKSKESDATVTLTLKTIYKERGSNHCITAVK